MAIYYGFGSAVVSEAEYTEKRRQGVLRKFQDDVKRNISDAFLEIAGQRLQATTLIQAPGPTGTPFTPIAFGAPLTVEIRWVYTGNSPTTSWFESSKDVLVTSAFKSISTFNEAPRAVNLLRQKVKDHSNIQWAATDKGTSLAFYTPAVAEPATLATFEFIFDDFPDDAVTKLGDAFTAAAGIPIFAAESAYFLAAGAVTKLLAKAGHSLFDGNVAFKATEEIAFAHPGDPPSIAGWRIVTQDVGSDDFANSVMIGANGQLFTKSDGKPYAGDTPYMVISLDGAAVDAYKTFTPTAASATLLDKFFGISDSQTQPLDIALDALRLYSDFNFRTRADALEKQLKALGKNDPKYAALNKQYEALKANILTDALKI